MPEVKEEILLRAELNQVYKLLVDMEEYPKFMSNVKEVNIIEEKEGLQITDWKTEIEGRDINWREKDIFHPESHRIDFNQIDGDLKEFSGYWQLRDEPEGVVVIFKVNFDLGIPGLAAFINPIIKRKLAANAQEMLLAFKEKIESQVINY